MGQRSSLMKIEHQVALQKGVPPRLEGPSAALPRPWRRLPQRPSEPPSCFSSGQAAAASTWQMQDKDLASGITGTITSSYSGAGAFL